MLAIRWYGQCTSHSGLPQLRHLHLSHNGLERLAPHSLDGFPHLETLRLGNNRLGRAHEDGDGDDDDTEDGDDDDDDDGDSDVGADGWDPSFPSGDAVDGGGNGVEAGAAAGAGGRGAMDSPPGSRLDVPSLSPGSRRGLPRGVFARLPRLCGNFDILFGTLPEREIHPLCTPPLHLPCGVFYFCCPGSLGADRG